MEFGGQQLSHLDSEIQLLLNKVHAEPDLPGPAEGTVAEAEARRNRPAPYKLPSSSGTAYRVSIKLAATTLVAEIGANRDQFPSAHDLASWAGLCPGNDESAGKRRSGKTRKGSVWLRRALCQAAWSASRTKNTYLAAQYHRLIVRKGKKRTIVAVAHSMLIIAYYLLKRQCTYQDLGPDYFNLLNEEAITQRLVKKLTGLGYYVTLQPARTQAVSQTA